MMNSICRLCNEEKSPLDFTAELNDTASSTDKQYKDLIEYHSRVALNPSKLLSQLICEECKLFIDKFAEFSIKLIDVQNKLEELLNECDISDQNEAGLESPKVFMDLNEKDIKSLKVPRKRLKVQTVQNSKDETIEELFRDEINGTSIFKSSLHINIYNESIDKSDDIPKEIAEAEGLCLRWKDVLCCGICSMSFENIIDLNNHIERIHGVRNKAYGCKNCDISYTALYDSSLVNHHVERHYREHLKFCCLICSKLFYNIISLIQHYNKVHGDIFNVMICFICGFYAKSFNELRDHKSYHLQMENCKPANQILCDKVLEKFHKGDEMNTFNTDVKMHERNSDGSVMNECQRRFKINWDFSKYVCPISSCLNESFNPFELFTHLKLKHPRESDQAKKIYTCSMCSENKEFSGMHYFYNHMAENHFASLKFTCVVCSRLFWNYLSLAMHYKNVHPSFTSVFCCHCGKIYHSITSASIHYKKIMILMNEEQKKLAVECKSDMDPVHICHVCGKTCKNQYTLVKHLTTHEIPDPTKMLQCHICSKLFNSKNKLAQHMVGHNNQRKWKCLVCGMSFNFKKLLQMHTRAVHEQERSFMCNFCQKQFFKKYDLTVHVRLHTGFFPYTCPVDDCDAKYPAWSNLFKHCQSRHKIDIRSESYKKLRASESAKPID